MAKHTKHTKQTKQNKRNDDDDGYDLIDPFKFMIGCFKVLFGLVKALYSGLTSSDPFVRAVTVVFVILALLFFGSLAYIQNIGL